MAQQIATTVAPRRPSRRFIPTELGRWADEPIPTETVVCGPSLGGAFLAQLIARAPGAGLSLSERVPSVDGAMYQARYRLPPAFGDRLRGQRVAIVDDVMSAGSALRGTYETLRENDAIPIVAGALLVLGPAGADVFSARQMPVCAAARDEFQL